MNVIEGIENFKAITNPVVTVGSFDGVHRAHKLLIGLMNREAAQCGGESLLITFHPHPRLVLPSSDRYSEHFRLLTDKDEKIRLLAKAGLQNVLFLDFNEKLAQTSYKTFIEDILVGTVGVKKMIVGFNHNFGHNREGGLESVKEYGRKFGFEVECFPEQLWNEQHFSSTKIRKLLEEGRVEDAKELLGYQYRLYGCFTESGFRPYSPHKIIPMAQDYLVRVRREKKYDFTLCHLLPNGKFLFPDLQIVPSAAEVKINFVKPL